MHSSGVGRGVSTLSVYAYVCSGLHLPHARAPQLRSRRCCDLHPLLPPAECCSLFPSRSYVLAEASTAPSGTAVVNGYYFISEVGYNPLSNSFGASTSQVW